MVVAEVSLPLIIPRALSLGRFTDSAILSAFPFCQARRLGLLVPGMPGYAAERERLILAFRGVSSTTEKPEIWDALGAQRLPGQEMEGGYWRPERYEPTGGNCLWDEKLVSALRM